MYNLYCNALYIDIILVNPILHCCTALILIKQIKIGVGFKVTSCERENSARVLLHYKRLGLSG